MTISVGGVHNGAAAGTSRFDNLKLSRRSWELGRSRLLLVFLRSLVLILGGIGELLPSLKLPKFVNVVIQKWAALIIVRWSLLFILILVMGRLENSFSLFHFRKVHFWDALDSHQWTENSRWRSTLCQWHSLSWTRFHFTLLPRPCPVFFMPLRLWLPSVLESWLHRLHHLWMILNHERRLFFLLLLWFPELTLQSGEPDHLFVLCNEKMNKHLVLAALYFPHLTLRDALSESPNDLLRTLDRIGSQIDIVSTNLETVLSRDIYHCESSF